MPDELLRSLPPHLPWGRFLSPAGFGAAEQEGRIWRAAAAGEGGGGRRGVVVVEESSEWQRGALGGRVCVLRA